jgi:hypothetical protein
MVTAPRKELERLDRLRSPDKDFHQAIDDFADESAIIDFPRRVSISGTKKRPAKVKPWQGVVKNIQNRQTHSVLT